MCIRDRLGLQAETTLRFAVCTRRPATKAIPFATEHAYVGPSSQAGFALSGEPIFFARPKKTGEKKRRPITWPAAVRRRVPCASRSRRALQTGRPGPTATASASLPRSALRADYSTACCDARPRDTGLNPHHSGSRGFLCLCAAETHRRRRIKRVGCLSPRSGRVSDPPVDGEHRRAVVAP